MAKKTPDREDQKPSPRAAEETFKREGPVPPAGDTGDTVEDMNEAAREAVLRNIRPDTPDA